MDVGTQRWTSRRLAATVGIVALTLVLVMLMARPVAGQEPGHGHGPTGAEGILPPDGWPEGQTGWTQEQIDYAVAKVQEVERVLPAKFGDITKMAELGYIDFRLTAPGGYDHWGRKDYNTDERTLDPEYPESLVFQRMPDGSRRLVAAMFFSEPGSTMTNILPSNIAWLPGWHTHEKQFCVNEQGQFVSSPNNGTCTTGSFSTNNAPMTHVWIVDNECGHRFAGIDSPGVVCYGHGGHEFPPGTFPGTVPPRPVTTTTTKPAPPTAPPATPVKATPAYTG